MSGFQLDNTASILIFLDEFRRYAADVRCRDHRKRLAERLEEARNDAAVSRRSDIPREVFHEPGRTQERDRRRQFPDGRLDDRVLCEQVRLAGLRPIVER